MGTLSGLAWGQTVVSIDAQAGRHAINPNIYGVAYATTAQLLDLNAPLNRLGGNNTSRYNWKLNADNRANDWYFESIGDASATPAERIDTFFSDAKSGGAQALITVPILPYLAKLAANRDYLWSFSQSKYGTQQATDPWRPDAGNGLTPNGQPITGNNPLDANTPNSVTMQTDFVKHLLAKWGDAASGGVRYYILDNEPAIWHATHRDVHPVGQTMDELYDLYVKYGGAIRATDPKALIVGPEEWGWTGYLLSGYDSQWASTHGWSQFPDRDAHGGMEHMAWLLQKMKAYEVANGKRLLDIFSLHYYPQGGEFWGDDSPTMRALRNRSTRSLWDPNYVDETWISDKIQLIPRMKNWVNTYYPGTPIAITEYNWGAEGTLSGATAQADVFGIFGREGLDMATRWTTPATNSPTYLAMKLYRNYDGAKSGFGDTGVACTVPNPDDLSAFAAERSADGALTVVVINKGDAAKATRLNIANFGVGTSASAWQLASETQTSLTKLPNLSLSGSTLDVTLPKQSVTMIVIPKGGSTAPAGYDFETGLEGWRASGRPITGLQNTKVIAASGRRSVAVRFSGSGVATAFVPTPGVAAGKTISFRVWVPKTVPLASIQPYALQGAGGGWAWSGAWTAGKQVPRDRWVTITVTVPANAVVPLDQIGVEFTLRSPWQGTVYLDAVQW